jgi:hypothetical protein
MFGIVVASWITVGAAAAQPSVAGNWTLEVDSPQGVMKVALALSVSGEALKGTISSEMGETPLTGTVKDGAIKFSFDFAGPQGPMSVTTTGTVTGDDIKGEMDYGMGVAPFSGKRAEK